MRLGVAHVPDGRGTFLDLSTEENLRLGAYTRRDRSAVDADLERDVRLFPAPARAPPPAGGTLSGGEQQMLAVSRALMLAPQLLLLDEPSFGLAPLVVREIFAILRAINEREARQHAAGRAERRAGARARRPCAYLLETGRVVLSRHRATSCGATTPCGASYLGY